MVLAARPAETWQPTTVELSQTLHVNQEIVRAVLAEHVGTWNADPRQASTSFGRDDAELRRRLSDAGTVAHSTTIGGRRDSTTVARPGLAEAGQDPVADSRRSTQTPPRR